MADERDMMHGRDWNGVDDLGGWLVMEKLDGCRVRWDGEALWTRSGNKIPAPARITAPLPVGVPLDGELWAGRGRFEEARLAVQAGRWTSRCRLAVFDAPRAACGFASRHASIRQMIPAGGAVFVVDARLIRDNWHVEAMRDRIQRAGGEGVMVFAPAAPYTAGRTGDVRKVK